MTELPGRSNAQSAPVANAAPAAPAAPVVAAEVVAPVVGPVVAPVVVPPPVAAVIEQGSLAELLDVWSAILEELESSKGSWVVVNSARPVLLEGDVLTLEFSEQMWVDRFKESPTSGKAVFEDLREAIQGALGVRLRFVPRLGMTSGSGSPAPVTPATSEKIDTPVASVETPADVPGDDAPTTKMEPVAAPETAAPVPATTETATEPAAAETA